jgi:uncharacterized membrane protein (DUF2068 family)
MFNVARGVRAVAIIEASKGALVLIAGFGLLSLVHHDMQAIAERLVRQSHMNPAHHYPRVFIEAASHINDSRLRALAALAFLYSLMRFIEAYGLWHIRAWAQWFGIISGSIYFPLEVYELLKHPTWVKGAVLLVNIVVVAYLLYARLVNRAGEAEVNTTTI